MSFLARLAGACAAWVCILCFMFLYDLNHRGPRK